MHASKVYSIRERQCNTTYGHFVHRISLRGALQVSELMQALSNGVASVWLRAVVRDTAQQMQYPSGH